MRQIVRSFSIGLFAAGIIMLAVYFLSDGPSSAENMELEELIPLVEEKGHRVVTEEDYISLSVQSSDQASNEETNNQEETQVTEESAVEEENNTKETEMPDDEQVEEEEAAPDEPVEYRLTIQSGMPSAEIGNLLQENNIIHDAKEFTDYLEEHDFSVQLKAGTHHVSSEMSFYELAMELISP